MAKIMIEPIKAKLILNQQSSLENTLKRLSQDVDSVRNGMRYKIAGQQNISQCLRDAAEQITKESQNTSALRAGLGELIARYECAERTNCDGITAEKVSVRQENGGSPTITADEFLELLKELLKNVILGKGFIIPGALELVGPVTPLVYLLTGLPLLGGTTASGSADWLGYETAEGHPGVTAWVGKASAEASGNWGSAEANGYLVKGEASAKADFSFWKYSNDAKKKNGEWENSEETTWVNAELSASATASVLAADTKYTTGNDMLGTEFKAEGGLGNATAKAKGEFSIGEEGINANVSGKAMVSAAEGKVSKTYNILGFEITAEVGGYAGALGVEGKIGIEDSKWVLKGGAAAVLGGSLGVEIGFNDTGWSNFLDIITFWD